MDHRVIRSFFSNEDLNSLYPVSMQNGLILLCRSIFPQPVQPRTACTSRYSASTVVPPFES